MNAINKHMKYNQNAYSFIKYFLFYFRTYICTSKSQQKNSCISKHSEDYPHFYNHIHIPSGGVVQV